MMRKAFKNKDTVLFDRPGFSLHPGDRDIHLWLYRLVSARIIERVERSAARLHLGGL